MKQLGRLSALVLGLVLAVSCFAPLVSSGDAGLAIILGGALPPSARDAGSKAFVPGSTTDIRVLATDPEEAVAYEQTFPASGGAIYASGLPAGVELRLSVEALDAGGATICAWQSPSRVMLNIGRNELSATLVPVAEPMAFSVTGLPSASGLFDLAEPGSVQFFDVSGSGPEGEARQILVDTGKARWAWMAVYDENWKPYPAICSDPGAGWAVVGWPASGRLKIAVANTVSSKGYPAGPIESAKLQVRPAALVTSVPEFQSVVNISGQTIVMREGVYEFPDTAAIGNDVRVYGGFNAGWASRSGVTELRLAAASASTITLQVTGGSAGGLLDRLSIVGRAINASVSNATGLYLAAVQPMVVNGCTISGSSNTSMITSTSNATAIGVQIGSGSPEIVGCTLRGGYVGVTGDYAASSTALSVEPIAGYPVTYIHDCVLDGGTSVSGGVGAISRGLSCSGADAKAVVVGCRIWGGRATAGSSGSGMSAGAVIASSASAWVVSCVINGGRTEGPQAAARGVYLNEMANVVAACTIDAGLAVASSDRSAECVYVQNAAVKRGIVSCNLFYNSTPVSPTPDRRVAITESDPSASYGLQQANGNGIIGCAALFKGVTEYANFSFLVPALINDNQYASASSPALEFRSVGAASDFPSFMAMDLRPSPDSTVAFTETMVALASWGLDAQTETYPALLFDLAGRPRPTGSSPWRRGAYNP